MTAIHAHRIKPFLGEWQLHETFDLMRPAPIFAERRLSIGNDGMGSPHLP
jgi:hypothetical protein